MFNSSTIKNLQALKRRHEEYVSKSSWEVTRKLIEQPLPPLSSYNPIIPDSLYEKLNINQNIGEYLFFNIFNSDNPIIIQKLKELLALIKLSDTSNKLTKIEKALSEFEIKDTEYNIKIAEENERVSKSTRYRNLKIAKNTQEFMHTMQDIINNIADRYDSGCYGIWEELAVNAAIKLVKQDISDFETNEHTKDTDYIKRLLDNVQIDFVFNFLESIIELHEEWFLKQYNFIYRNQLIEVQKENLFDSTNNIMQPDELTKYVDNIVKIAKKRTEKIISKHQYDGKDGYDVIYFY
jgi:hypothetical protein